MAFIWNPNWGKVFNRKVGEIHVPTQGKNKTLTWFTSILGKENKLLKNVCLEVGNFWRESKIKDNEISIIKRK